MAWDDTKPVASSLLNSAEMRANYVALQSNLAGVNLIADPYPLIWAASTVSAPSHYTLSGGSASIAASTSVQNAGGMSAQVTAATSAAATLQQSVLTTDSYDDYFDSEVFSFGASVYTGSASAARIGIYDGADTSYSSYHTGSTTWEWLTGTRTIASSATQVTFRLEVAAATHARINGITVMLGQATPKQFVPGPVSYGTIKFPWAGAGSTTGGPNSDGTDLDRHIFARPALVKDVQLHLVNAPSTTSFIVDVNQDGNSMFSTPPQIANGANAGSAQPDGTYQYRCFTGRSGSTITNAKLSYDITQVGSSTAGSYLTVHVRCLQFMRPLESLLGYDEVS
jgi:hypothetical protein